MEICLYIFKWNFQGEMATNFWFQTFCPLENSFVYIFVITRDFWLKSLEQPTICKAERLETFEGLNLPLNLNHICDVNKGNIDKNDLSNNQY